MAEQFLPVLSPLAVRLQSQFPRCEILAMCFSCNGVHVTIDHPEGVNVQLTTQIAKSLRPLLPGCGIQVSSPGSQRPLSKQHHFQKAVGHNVSVKTKETHHYGKLILANSEFCRLETTNSTVDILYHEIEKAKKCK